MDSSDPRPDMTLELFLAIALAAPTLVSGILVRMGRYRGALKWYEKEEAPRVARNGALALIPLGLGSLLAAVLFGFFEFADNDRTVGIAALFLLPPVAILFLSSLVFQYRPPEWIKPRWLREGEREPEDPRGYTVSRRQWRIGWAVAFVALAVAFALDAPSAVFAGLGSGMALLAVARPRS